jgi:YVTN family beta-propeller protein
MKSKSWLMFLGVFLFCIFFSATAVYAAPFAYIPNSNSNNVSVIDIATNTVIGPPINVGTFPIALGLFIGTPPPPAAPAVNCWGMISFMLIAGFGAIYFLRARKRAQLVYDQERPGYSPGLFFP